MIRRVSFEELTKVADLWVKMVLETRPDWKPRKDWWLAMAENLMDNGNYYVLAINDHGVFKGFLDCILFPEPSTGKIHAVGQHFFVEKELRRTGLAGIMYQKMVKAVSNEHDFDYVDLFCFQGQKPFWENRGFKQVRCLMRKDVNINV